ncbi:MAG: N-acetylglucosamine-6-phosphate deacetylase [Janthinobacterium lividum]
MKRICGRDPETGKAIQVDILHGRITSIGHEASEETSWLSPGLIDLQVNGYGGFDLNAEGLTPEVVCEVARRVLETGVTTFLPTLITASEARIVAALRAIAEARRQDSRLAHMIPGVHIEGPHLSPEDGARGAHPREHIRPPSLEEFAYWQEACGGLVTLVTVSPHFPQIAAYVAALRGQGVHVSLGHSHCTADEVRVAVEAGAELSTHLGNGVAGSLPRHPNLLWAQLAEDRLMAMLIADGHHLPVDTLKVMLRAKGLDRTILVSDAVALAGMPAGAYDAAVGGHVELSPEGRLCMAETPFLAGAALPLKDGVAHVVRAAGMSLGSALRMATVNPGRFVGGRGRLEVGAEADLVLFQIDDHGAIKIEQTVVEGEPW